MAPSRGESEQFSPYHDTVKELLVIQTAVLHAARLAQIVI